MSYFSNTLVRALGADNVVRTLDKNDLSGSRSLFNEALTLERTPLIELNSALGLSVLRDVIAVTNTGTVTNSGGEHILATGATTSSTASLVSVEYGRYYPGTSAACGLGVRAPGTYTGTAFAEWGYFNGSNGFGWGKDATGPYIFYTRNSVQTKVYQANWNVDKVLGSGASGATLTQSDGNIYQINFSWYGYGVIEWAVVADNSAGEQVPIVVNRYRPTSENSIQNPNQPIAARVSNGNTTTNYAVYVGGRQFSIYGRYIPAIRRTQESRLALASVGTTFLPLVTFRRKAGYEGFPVKFHEVGIVASANVLWEVRLGATLTGAIFGAVSDVPAAETSLEADITATAMSGGQKIESGLVSASGSGSNTSGGFLNDSFNLELPGTTVITLCARAIAGTATISAILGMEEEW